MIINGTKYLFQTFHELGGVGKRLGEEVIYETDKLCDEDMCSLFKIKIEQRHDDEYYSDVVEWTIRYPSYLKISIEKLKVK